LKNFFSSAFSPAILLISAVSVLLLFVWQGNQGLSIWDEGYLWYGAQRVVAGEVPMRDFMAYDIGRYYWSAAMMSMLGDNGVIAMRISTALVQVIALYIGLAILPRNTTRELPFLMLATVTIIVWMTPQFRMFDIALPIMLIGVLALLIERPSIKRYLLAGLTVGLAAVFGRNHGMYGIAGSLCAMGYIALKRGEGVDWRFALPAWGAGVAIGYLPVLLFIFAVPGYATVFWENFPYLFGGQATPLAIPVPWPWRVPLNELPVELVARGITKGIFYIAIVAFCGLGFAWVIRKKLRNEAVAPVLVASIFMAIPYAQFTFSRADIEHLVSGIPPLLIGSLVWLSYQPAKIRWSFSVLLCGSSLLVMLPNQPGWYCHYSRQCVEINVAGDTLDIDRGTAGVLTSVNQLARQLAPGNRTFIAAPFWPGAYAAEERRSPMWQIFALFPQNPEFQKKEIESIKAADPGFAVIYDFPLDGREELRFRNTNPLVEQYIREHFDRINPDSKNSEFQIYRSRR